MVEPAELGAVVPGRRVAEAAVVLPEVEPAGAASPAVVLAGVTERRVAAAEPVVVVPGCRVAVAGPVVEPAEPVAVSPGVEPVAVSPGAAPAVAVLAVAASPAVVLAGVTEHKVAAAGPAVEPAALLHRIDRREPHHLFLVHILYISYETPF